MRSLSVPLDMQMAPLLQSFLGLRALKSSLTQDIYFDLSHKKTQIATLLKSKSSILSLFYKPTITFTPTKLSARAGSSYLSKSALSNL